MPRKCLCGKYASFNISGEFFGMYCSKCKTDEMIDVKNKRCRCGKQPRFNTPTENIGVCCKECKTSEMIDVVTRKCSCGNRPSFNVSGETKGIRCSKCKTEDMVDVVNKRCPCGKQPKFNLPAETVGICCKKCKTNEMILIGNKRCSCGKHPNFNMPGETKGICCFKCKTDDMIDVKSKICPGYECPVRTYLSNGHQYCMVCDPNDARRKRYKRYEEAFFEYARGKLDVRQREFRVTFDPNETSKKFARLDGVVFGNGVIVCIEVDEDGHQEYECDEHRMHLVTAELLQKHPSHVVSWVRVNPTVGSKNEWSGPSKKIREKRFEEVIDTVNDILETRDTRVVYVGF